jgi:hypothetical protein
MLGLLHFVLAILVLPFKSKTRLEAENAVVCTENSKPDVMMVKSAEDRVRTKDSDPLNRTTNRRILVQGPMRSDGVVVSSIGN